MPEKQPTRDQHYVPQEHLRGFSQDHVSIYEFNIKMGAPIEIPVPIESICREKDLYEIRDSKGQIMNVNYLEDILCKFEGLFAEYKRRLLNKAKHRENFRTRCFLTKEEKQFWTFYTALQVVRIPTMLQGTAEILKEAYPGYFTDSEAANAAREFCLPFFSEPSKDDVNSLLAFISILMPKSLSVGYAPCDRIFTSDTAVYGYSPKNELFDFETLWFPITSSATLLFADRKTKMVPTGNILFPLDEASVDGLNLGIAGIAKTMVLSKYPFRDKDIEIIREARRLSAEKTPKYDLYKDMGES